jgi:hypothetical protein
MHRSGSLQGLSAIAHDQHTTLNQQRETSAASLQLRATGFEE